MSTHFRGPNSRVGQFTACGRLYENADNPGRGVVITATINEVTCQGCIRSESFRAAKTRVSRPLDAPLPTVGQSVDGEVK